MGVSALRALPSVDRVLGTQQVGNLLSRFEREPVTRLVREVLEGYRAQVRAGQAAPSLQAVADEVVVCATRNWLASPRMVINATGVVLHTNLGRAPLSWEALQAIRVAGGYSSLEYDIATGGRGSRQDHIRSMLQSLTGAEDAYVTVNNAAAVMVALAAVARGKDVIVSRGQAVEIGGGFRVPVILRQSGARLVEVGTTNRTRLDDYAEAVSPRTAAILHVHSSNFRVIGFVEQPSLSDLADLAHEKEVVLVDDNGSGSLLDTAQFGMAHEPTPAESLSSGADVVAFSGDKLLGGPQAGILLGRTDLIRRISSHPLARTVRPDKVAVAALAATLLAYLRGEAQRTLPVWQMISQSGDQLELRAARLQRAASDRGLSVDLEPGRSTVGGGSLPGETLPTTLVVLPHGVTAEALLEGDPPVVARTRNDRVNLDLRSVREDEEPLLLETVIRAVRTQITTPSFAAK